MRLRSQLGFVELVTLTGQVVSRHETNVSIGPRMRWDGRLCSLAVRRGDRALLEWAWRHGCSLGSACDAAAEVGSLDLLTWLFKHGGRLSERTFEWAAQRTDGVMMRWVSFVGRL